MNKLSMVVMTLLVLVLASPVFAQEGEDDEGGLLFALAGVQYHLREPLAGGLAENETAANLRAELGVGLLGRDSADFAPFVYGGDFRFLLSAATLSTTSVVMADIPLRGAFGAQFGDILVAAHAGPGMYTAVVTEGGDATRISVGWEASVKAVLTFGLYAEAAFVAPEGIALLQDSAFLAPAPAGFRLGIGFNFLSATPQEIREMQPVE